MGVASPYGLNGSPTLSSLFSASTRSMAISFGLVGQRPTRCTCSHAPGAEIMRGADGTLLALRDTWGNGCHTIG